MRSKKIQRLPELIKIIKKLRAEGKRIVTTNGVFDILHVGHVRYLEKSKTLGDVLVVAVNSDASTKKNKGIKRPFNSQYDRAEVLAALESVDYVTFFEEKTPVKFLKTVKPDVHTKGGNYKISDVVGRKIVRKYGGKVYVIPGSKKHSTTGLVKKILERYKNKNCKN